MDLMPRVIFFLPTVSGYMDRVNLLMEASDQLGRFTLLVGSLDRQVDHSAHRNFDIVEIGFKRRMRPLNMWKSSRVAERILRQQGADIVHDTMGMLYPLFRKKSDFPSVQFVTSFFILFGWRLSHVWGQHSKLRLLTATSTAMMYPNRWIERRMARIADHIVLQAPGLTDHLASDVPAVRNKTHVITNNVEADFWTPPLAAKDTDNNKCNLLFVGSVDHSKGIFVLLDTMAELRDRGANAALTVVGKPNQIAANQVDETVHRMQLGDIVRFENRVNREQLREFYREADLFIYQTINDGSPRVVLEALACGLPVIGSRHPGIQVLDPDEEFVAFSDFGDIQAIADHVEDFISDRDNWKQRSEVGRERIETDFSSSAVAQQYADLYNSIVSEDARSSMSAKQN
ncbi:MAG: glycosyltransferase family 4 protein [SAR202 cluster bacterium]|nr:glycosyltransferase family 4 protein [SAR202 cluster bacterium]